MEDLSKKERNLVLYVLSKIYFNHYMQQVRTIITLICYSPVSDRVKFVCCPWRLQAEEGEKIIIGALKFYFI